MINHERLVEEVVSRAGLTSTDTGVRTVRVTLAALAHRLEMPQRRRLRQALPEPEREAAYVIVPPAGGGLGELSEEIGRNLLTTPERALYLAQTVLSHVAQADPELGQELREHLPSDFARLFSPAEPHRAHR